MAGVHCTIVFHKTDADFWYQIFKFFFFFMKDKQSVLLGSLRLGIHSNIQNFKGK